MATTQEGRQIRIGDVVNIRTPLATAGPAGFNPRDVTVVEVFRSSEGPLVRICDRDGVGAVVSAAYVTA